MYILISLRFCERGIEDIEFKTSVYAHFQKFASAECHALCACKMILREHAVVTFVNHGGCA